MKIGLRVPSFKKRLAARTSWKRVVRHNLGVKAPRGFGFITNPKKALYNRVYNKTTVSVDQLINTVSSPSGNKKHLSGGWIIFLIIIGILFAIFK